MQFLDEAKIHIRSGKGGPGCLSFRREKYIEHGGPNGGNGGKGGDVIFVATANLNTLIDFKYNQHYKAKNGLPGEGNNRTGASAEDLVIPIPVGTEILDAESGDVLIDMTKEGQQFIALVGGRGGRGNASFVSSVNRAPRETTPGEEAQELEIVLRLKLLADVGLIGLPNAGKSTFLSTVSNARPKIGDYPFTTLKPQLGIVKIGDGNSIVMADLPGLIEGAAEGKGRGHRFLQHTSRCQALLHLIDTSLGQDAVKAYRTIRKEVKAYDDDFGTETSDLPEIVALTKADALDETELTKTLKALKLAKIKNVHVISASTGQGMQEVLRELVAIKNLASEN